MELLAYPVALGQQQLVDDLVGTGLQVVRVFILGGYGHEFLRLCEDEFIEGGVIL